MTKTELLAVIAANEGCTSLQLASLLMAQHDDLDAALLSLHKEKKIQPGLGGAWFLTPLTAPPPKPRFKAHLCAKIRVDGTPFPRVCEISIMSTHPMSTTIFGDCVYAEIMVAEGDSFQEASDKIREIIQYLGAGYLNWAELWFDTSFPAHVERGRVWGRCADSKEAARWRDAHPGYKGFDSPWAKVPSPEIQEKFTKQHVEAGMVLPPCTSLDDAIQDELSKPGVVSNTLVDADAPVKYHPFMMDMATGTFGKRVCAECGQSEYGKQHERPFDTREDQEFLSAAKLAALGASTDLLEGDISYASAAIAQQSRGSQSYRLRVCEDCSHFGDDGEHCKECQGVEYVNLNKKA